MNKTQISCIDRWVKTAALFGALIAVVAGCGGGNTAESYHPEDLTAQQALEKALTAWKNGEAKPDSLAAAKPGIRVTDERWVNGTKLKDFKIGEPLDVDGPPQFPVTLTFDGASEPEKETYVVFGKDPLWVWTKAEYDRGGGM